MQGTPFCYRFRVPPDHDVIIPDEIRGDVKFNTNALGDFVILRSNGLPVYNFCVAIDDALMRITHVIRAVRPLCYVILLFRKRSSAVMPAICKASWGAKALGRSSTSYICTRPFPQLLDVV